MPSRWDGDDRGRGIGEAEQLVTGARELIAAFSEPTWVAEQPEAYLRSHVEKWCQQDGRLALRGASIDESHAYVLDLEWRGESPRVGQARAAVYSLIGSFAESATYVRQHRIDSHGMSPLRVFGSRSAQVSLVPTPGSILTAIPS